MNDHSNNSPTEIGMFLDLRVDWAFKYFFFKKENLVKLLGDVLDMEVLDIEYLPNEIPVYSEKDKRSVMDVQCRTTTGKYIIEMQYAADSDMDDRLMYYGASALHNQVDRGADKYHLLPVYVLCIANYVRSHSVTPSEDQVLFHYQMREKETGEILDGNKLSFYYLELSRLQKIWDKLSNNTERWCFLFRNFPNFAKGVPVPADLHGFEQVVENARTGGLSEEQKTEYRIAMITEYDKLVIGEYHLQKGIEQGLQQGLQQGIQQGIEQNTIATAKKLISMKMDVRFICEVTGLPEDKVKSLMN